MSFLAPKEENVGQANFLRQLASQMNQQNDAYGQREDGTGKGPGFMGAVPNRYQGGNSTELSIGVDPPAPYRGNVMQDGYSYNSIPSMVPTLTPDELQWVLAGNQPTREIQAKAEEFARARQAQGKPAFRGWEEDMQYPVPRGTSR